MATTAAPHSKRQPARQEAHKSVRPAKPVEARAALNMRIQPELRSLIDRAAEATGKNRTDFVLDAARQAAQNTLLDRVHVQLEPTAFAAFLQLLEAPAWPNDNLRKALQTPAPWD